MKKLKMMPPPLKKRKFSLLTTSLFVVLCVYFIGLLIPFIWAAYSSLNDPSEYYEFYSMGGVGNFPTASTFDNYSLALTKYFLETDNHVKYTFFGMLINSVGYSFGCAFFYTLTPLVVAYCAARFRFKFSKIIYAFVIITMSLPIIGAMPSEIAMLKTLRLHDTFFGMFVLRMNFLSIYFLIFYAQFQMIPMTYSEAAKVDGASNFRIMTRIIVPQTIPTIITVFLLSFITFWNDYQIPRYYLPNYPTVAYGLFAYVNNSPLEFQAVPIQLAALIGLTVPIVIVFGLLNKYLKLNVATGGIKG